MVENRKENMHTDVGCKEWTQLRVESARFQCDPILHYTCSPLNKITICEKQKKTNGTVALFSNYIRQYGNLSIQSNLGLIFLVSLYFVLKLVWKIFNILSNYNFLRLSHSHLPAPQKVSSFYFYFSLLLFICSFSRFGHRDNGRISTQPRTSLCIQFSDKKNYGGNKRLPLGLRFFFFFTG